MHQRKLNQQECSYAVQYILFNDRSKQARSLIITCWSDDNKAHPLFRVLSVARMHAVNWIDCSRDNASNSNTNLLRVHEKLQRILASAMGRQSIMSTNF